MSQTVFGMSFTLSITQEQRFIVNFDELIFMSFAHFGDQAQSASKQIFGRQ
jgi:hypothetical protein